MSTALLQWRRLIQRPKQDGAENACQLVVLQSGNLGQQYTEYYVPPNLVPTERLSTAMAYRRNCLRRNCVEQRESHSGSAKSKRQSVVISLSDKDSVGG